MSRVAHTVLSALFLTALVVPPLVARQRERSAEPPPAAEAETIRRYGFSLREVSQEAGVRFVHRAPTLDSKLNHIMTQVASMGAGVSVVDFDRDGLLDFYATNSGEGSKNALYRNLGNGKFEDVAADLGVADVNAPESGVSMGAVWADYDNDGFEDLYVNKWGRPELFHNEHGKSFRRVTEGSGLPSWVNANSAVWLDYDRDGLVDLFIGGYYSEGLNLWKLENTLVMPESFEYARNGGRKYLLKNLGSGKFRDVTEDTGLVSRRWALAAAAADLRGTGYPDLVIANDYGVSEYFANEPAPGGGRRFREVGRVTGIGVQPKSGMNVCFGDVDNTGQFAIYITNITEAGQLTQYNNLWCPKSKSGNVTTYANEGTERQVGDGGWSFGAQFGDLNNDGNQDLFLTNGYVSDNRGRDYWYDFSLVAGGNTSIIQDAAKWPAMDGKSLSGYQQKRVWLNTGAGEFKDVAPLVGVRETFDGRAVAQADFWNRGALDVAVASQKAPLLLYRNSVDPKQSWIQIELEGTRSNRSAIGALVEVGWSGKKQVQVVSGASGFCAQNQRRLHFGLGGSPSLERVTIQWPSGKRQTLTDLKVNQLHYIREPE